MYRVLRIRNIKNSPTLYLVKWRDLSYEYCTWEPEGKSNFVFHSGLLNQDLYSSRSLVFLNSPAMFRLIIYMPLSGEVLLGLDEALDEYKRFKKMNDKKYRCIKTGELKLVSSEDHSSYYIFLSTFLLVFWEHLDN